MATASGWRLQVMTDLLAIRKPWAFRATVVSERRLTMCFLIWRCDPSVDWERSPSQRRWLSLGRAAQIFCSTK
eukprot:6368394-Pyramimonas_sp.AAC.1